jgi:hypothetical protein
LGYGHHRIEYADGKTKEFHRIGINSNKTGISVYILGLIDKGKLCQTYANKIGKVSVTGIALNLKL